MNTENQSFLLGAVIVIVLGALFGLNQFFELTMPIVALVVGIGALTYAWRTTDVISRFVVGFAGFAIFAILLVGSISTSAVFVENKGLKKENETLKANPAIVIGFDDMSPEEEELVKQKLVPNLIPTAWLVFFAFACLFVFSVLWHFVPESTPWWGVQVKDILQWVALILIALLVISNYLHLEGTSQAYHYGWLRGGAVAISLFVFSKVGDLIKGVAKHSGDPIDWVVTAAFAALALVGEFAFFAGGDFFFLSKIVVESETSATAAVLAAQAGAITYASFLGIGKCIAALFTGWLTGKK